MIRRMRIISWNVNGIRAAERKGFLDWLAKESPDIVGVQETKAHPEQLSEVLLNPPGYHVYFHSAEKRGYSGVATFSKEKPVRVSQGYGDPKFDSEGRVIETEFKDFVLLNIYFPNGGRDEERLKYKLDFYEATFKHVAKLRKAGKSVITMGDYNTAHQPIDLANPEKNENVSGFMPIERAWLDKWIASGQVDIFREFCSEGEKYSWWDQRTRARDRNEGWRIDYHFVTEELMPKVKHADIHMDQMNSDHCPISLELNL